MSCLGNERTRHSRWINDSKILSYTLSNKSLPKVLLGPNQNWPTIFACDASQCCFEVSVLSPYNSPGGNMGLRDARWVLWALTKGFGLWWSSSKDLFQLKIFYGPVINIYVTLGSFVRGGKIKSCIWCLKVQSLPFQYLKYHVLYKVDPTTILKMFTMNHKYSQQCDFIEVTRDLHSHKQDHNLVLCPFTKGFY